MFVLSVLKPKKKILHVTPGVLWFFKLSNLLKPLVTATGTQQQRFLWKCKLEGPLGPASLTHEIMPITASFKCTAVNMGDTRIGSQLALYMPTQGCQRKFESVTCAEQWLTLRSADGLVSIHSKVHCSQFIKRCTKKSQQHSEVQTGKYYFDLLKLKCPSDWPYFWLSTFLSAWWEWLITPSTTKCRVEDCQLQLTSPSSLYMHCYSCHPTLWRLHDWRIQPW